MIMRDGCAPLGLIPCDRNTVLIPLSLPHLSDQGMNPHDALSLVCSCEAPCGCLENRNWYVAWEPSAEEKAIGQDAEDKTGKKAIFPILLHEGKVEHRDQNAHVGREHQHGDPEIDKKAGTNSIRDQ